MCVVLLLVLTSKFAALALDIVVARKIVHRCLCAVVGVAVAVRVVTLPILLAVASGVGAPLLLGQTLGVGVCAKRAGLLLRRGGGCEEDAALLCPHAADVGRED